MRGPTGRSEHLAISKKSHMGAIEGNAGNSHVSRESSEWLFANRSHGTKGWNNPYAPERFRTSPHDGFLAQGPRSCLRGTTVSRPRRKASTERIISPGFCLHDAGPTEMSLGCRASRPSSTKEAARNRPTLSRSAGPAIAATCLPRRNGPASSYVSFRSRTSSENRSSGSKSLRMYARSSRSRSRSSGRS
jgi:hypothetical protein